MHGLPEQGERVPAEVRRQEQEGQQYGFAGNLIKVRHRYCKDLSDWSIYLDVLVF